MGLISLPKNTRFKFLHHIDTGRQQRVVPITQANTRAPNSLKSEVITTTEGFEKLENSWNTLVHRNDVEAHVFQSFDWQRIWWKNFGGNNELRILAVWRHGNLVGVAPFFIDKTPFWYGKELKKLRLIGSTIPDKNAVGIFTSYSMSDYLDVIIDPDYQEEVIDAMMEFLEECRRKVDKIIADELPGTGPFIQELLPEIEERGWSYEKKEKDLSTQLNLPDTVDECLDEMHSKARYELRYSMRSVTQKEKFQVNEVQSKEELEAVFNTFVDLHQKRWNQIGFPGVFVNKNYETFLKEVGQAAIERGNLKMSTAVDNEGNTIAVDFAIQFKDRVYNYQKAFDAESELSKYSPGKALTYFLIEHAIAEGLECVDLLRGAEKYKMRMTNQATRNWMLTIPGQMHDSGFTKYFYRLIEFSEKLKELKNQEWLLLKVHLQQWGILGFLPRYFGFLAYRIKEKF